MRLNTRQMQGAGLALAWLMIALLAGPRPAAAQFFQQATPAPEGNIQGFTVAGKGTATAKPNRLEIEVEISAASELTADAIVKYRDAKKRLQEAFSALKLSKVAVEEKGLKVSQKGTQMNPYFFDYQPNRKTKAEVELTRKLVITCSEIRELDEEALLQLVARLLDVAQDAGGKVGSGQDFNPYYYRFNPSASGLVRFVLDDYDAIEERAYQQAIADAEAKAKRLAKLSRVELGPIAGVRVASAPGERPASFNDMNEPDDEAKPRRLESPKFQEMPVKVELVVRFDLGPGRDKPKDGRVGGQ